MPNLSDMSRLLVSVLLLFPNACFLLGCSTHETARPEMPIAGILSGEMNHQHDPVKTERFVERVGEQSSYIAELTFANGLKHINCLPARDQNTASAYIRAWQALRYFDLELSAGVYLRPYTAFTVLETLEKNTWASVRQQAAGILARITGYQPDEPPPDPFFEAKQAGGPRAGSLKNLNEPVRSHPYGLITPVRQTCTENDYYTRLGKTYRLILEGKEKQLPAPPAGK